MSRYGVRQFGITSVELNMAGYYSNEEKFDMLSCFILSGENCNVAERMYLDKYPERRQAAKRTYSKLVTNLKEHGAFKKPMLSRKKNSNQEKVFSVLLAVTENPGVSTREIDENVGVAKSTAQFILKKQKFHPYKYRICQGLRPGDAERRRSFCEWYTRKCHENINFPYQIIWSDESMVNRNGIFNRKNVHYWSKENPRVFKESRHQYRFGFNMWAGILGTRIIGPFFYQHNLTSEHYLNLLQNDLEEALDNLPLAEQRDTWFQQDGAPAHNSRVVREYISARFPEKSISTYSVTPWPARSPDLTPLDFFLWGYIENCVYKQNFETEEELRQLVLAAFHSVTPQMLTNVLNNTVLRSYLCLENDGNHFEHLLEN